MIRFSFLKKIVYCLPFFLLGSGSLALGQVAPAAASGSGLNAFVSFGGQKTHVIDFNYNSLGVDGGLYLQRSPLFGVEVRAASYSIHARYSQMPITTGYRAEKRAWEKYLFAGYAGAGMSRAQDAGPHYVTIPAEWSPCFQASQSGALDFGRFKWKIYEATFTDTFTSRRSLPAFSLTTGIVYTLSRNRR